MTSDDDSTSSEPTSSAGRRQRQRKRRKVGRVFLIVSLAAETLVLSTRGYGLGGHVVVRCRRGHLFTTIWIPGGSLKALRLGWTRFQRCPVGGHWDLVTPVRLSELTDEERLLAEQHHDVRIP
jgi:hypothetical protein